MHPDAVFRQKFAFKSQCRCADARFPAKRICEAVPYVRLITLVCRKRSAQGCIYIACRTPIASVGVVKPDAKLLLHFSDGRDLVSVAAVADALMGGRIHMLRVVQSARTGNVLLPLRSGTRRCRPYAHRLKERPVAFQERCDGAETAISERLPSGRFSPQSPPVGFQAGVIDRWHRNSDRWWGPEAGGTRMRWVALAPRASDSCGGSSPRPRRQHCGGGRLGAFGRRHRSCFFRYFCLSFSRRPYPAFWRIGG